MTHNFPLPPNFVESLLDLTFIVMTKKPDNYILFAAKYFGRIANKESLDGILMMQESMMISRESTDTDDSMDEDQYNNKRQSVAAEKFDPEDINSDDLKIKVHDKTPAQRMKLKQVCENVALFNSLTQSDLMSIIDAMFEMNVESGQDIIEEGDNGDNFYVIESGIFDVFITDKGTEKKIKTYEDEGSFGELALIYNAPRAATIKARTNGVIWAVTRQVFRTVVLVKASRQREIYNKILADVPMLQTLSDYERANIADALLPKECLKDELILREGDPGNQMYFIISGEVEIFKTMGSKRQVIVTLDTGKYFGELALLSNQPRAASAIATHDTQLAILDVKSFERLMGPCIQVMKRNMQEYKKQVMHLFNS